MRRQKAANACLWLVIFHDSACRSPAAAPLALRLAHRPHKMPSLQDATLNVRKFRPSFSQEELSELKRRVGECRRTLPRETYAMRQEQYGITHEWMYDTLKYWEENFDWYDTQQSEAAAS